MSGIEFRSAIKRAGYCCPWAAIRDGRRLNTAALSSDLDVSPRTLRWWKAKVKAKVCRCECVESCKKGDII